MEIRDCNGKRWDKGPIPAENPVYKLVDPEWGKLYDDEGHLVYKGFLVDGMAFGSGTAYYPNGNISQEGLFGPKGLISGRIYYENGQVRFEGSFQHNSGYGPNWPIFGAWYNENGELKYYGTFKVIGRGGSVHMPEVLEPEGFGSVEKMMKGFRKVFGGGKADRFYRLDQNPDAATQSPDTAATLPNLLRWSKNVQVEENGDSLILNQNDVTDDNANRQAEGTDFLLDYRKQPDMYHPLVDHQYKHFDEWEDEIARNQCWSAGLLEGNRPYFMECWKVFLTTFITIFVSSDGIGRTETLRLLERAGLIECANPQRAKPKILEFRDSNGNEFYSINTVISVDGGCQFLYWNGNTHPFDELNQLNEQGDKEDEKDY